MDDKASDHAAVVPHGSHDLLRMAMIYATPAGRVQPPVAAQPGLVRAEHVGIRECWRDQGPHKRSLMRRPWAVLPS